LKVKFSIRTKIKIKIRCKAKIPIKGIERQSGVGFLPQLGHDAKQKSQ